VTERDDSAARPHDRLWSRREFTATVGTTLGALAAAGLPGRQAAEPPSRRIGLQLYTVRDNLDRDFEGTLAQLAHIGYREVEFAGLHGHPAREVRAIIDRLGLKATGGHYDLAAIQDTLDQTIGEAKALGYEYIITPWLADEFRTVEGYARVADLFNHAGETIRAAGLGFGYHNHNFEFAPLPGGAIGYDLLLERTDPKLVCMELDLYWIRSGGRDALDYFRRYPNRFRLVHVKDMAADGSMVDLGKGAINWPELLAAAKRVGVRHFFVEHDQAQDPLAFARSSFTYLSTLNY